VKQSHWLGLLCLLGAIALFVLAPMDVPDTAFSQMEAPVAVSHPRLPAARLAPPSIASQHVSDEFRGLAHVGRHGAFGTEQNRYARRASDMQNLLCVFLI
jgi:hypothetical protein